ncbi:glycosyltransferase [Rothia uropygialis]|uniref:glycosyltransferase n=1 Tax=Kocuria sp. 36 TaxID=1415402 RepID=UPI0013EA194E|nr:glycosyltransferase [Kocuria sp. 36]
MAGKAKPRRILLLAVRDVTGVRTGRIAVLESAVRGLQRHGHHVDVLAITHEDGPTAWLGCEVRRIHPPRLGALAALVPCALLRGRSLNEALFSGRALIHKVREIARELNSDVVVGDGLRTWDLARTVGLPVVMHLDDLLSERYSSKTFRDNNDSVLGYFGDRIPRLARPGAEAVAKCLLGVEAKLARRREDSIAREARVVALTSYDEARRLSLRTGREVLGIPMAVEQGRICSADQAAAGTLTFLGVLHYGPNIAALRYIRDELVPELERRGRRVRIRVIGKASPEQIQEFAGAPFEFLGYVENLPTEMSASRMLISPIRAGTGVKTKVLDALSIGLPVVATPMGVAGIPVRNGVSALVADTASGLADAVEDLMDHPERARDIGRAGYDLLGTSMSPEHIYNAWGTVVEQAVGEESHAH